MGTTFLGSLKNGNVVPELARSLLRVEYENVFKFALLSFIFVCKFLLVFSR